VTFSTKKLNGPVRKSVHVVTSDANAASFGLQIAALVGGAPATLGVEPPAVDFDRFAADAPQHATVKLTNYSPEPMHVSIIDPPLEYMTAKLSGEIIEPRHTVELTVATHGTPPLGKFSTGVTLLLDETRNTRMTIPVIGTTMMR
jgi:hypothetical protein